MIPLKDKLRLGTVKRWHMVRVLREQTVAEHVALVQLIGLQILEDFGSGYVDSESSAQLMKWALYHDMPEVYLGDMPTPSKQEVDLKSPGLIDGIEMERCPEYAKIKSKTPELIKMIVKFADLFEAVKFISEEGHGQHASEVKQLIMNDMNAMVSNMLNDELPSVSYLGSICKLYVEGFFNE